MRKSFLASALFAVAILAGCNSPAPTSVTVQVGQQCEPINQYDTRCEMQASRTAAPSAPTMITLARSAHIRYEINPGPSGERPYQVHYQKQTDRGLWEKTGAQAKDLPWVVEFDAPAGVTPWMRWGQGGDDATCRVLIDGKDVTLRLRAVVSSTYECAAGSQP